MSVLADVINLRINVNGSQSQNELNELRKKAKDLTTDMQGLKKGTQEYADKAKALKGVNSEMDSLKKTIGVTALSQKELTSELSKLKSLRGSMVPFSAEFKALSKEIAGVESRLYNVRNGVQGFSSLTSKLSGGIKGIGIAAAGFFGFQAITQSFSKILEGASKLSDQLADLRRVSGFTADEAANLNQQLLSIDSRTSAEGLRNIAITAGKLGVAKQDIFSFTQAVDMLVVSLGDELGNADQITTQLGKILNVFDGKVTGENITQLGNAFVELANAGVASGAFIADFDQRLSGIAKSAGIGLGELSGLGAGLEELGGRVESSSTAIQKLLISIAQDLPAAAKIAGMSTKEFSNLYSTNGTEALLKYSEGLVKNKDSFAAVTNSLKDAGEEGARTVETISKLGTSANLLREKIDLGKRSLQENTAITEAFRLKNETLAASVDKLKKEFDRLVSESRLADFVKAVVQGFTQMILPSKTLTEQFKEQDGIVKKLETNTLPLIDRYEELKKKSTLNKDEQIELNKAITAIGNTIPGAITQFDKYGRALGINAEKAREFIRLQQAILKERNRDAIKEQEELLKTIQFNADAQQRMLNKGTITETIGGTMTSPGTDVIRRLTDKEILASQVQLAGYQDRLTGIKGIIQELKGEAMKVPEVAPPAAGGTGGTGGNDTGGGSGKDAKDAAAKKLEQMRSDAAAFAQELKRLRSEAEGKTMEENDREIMQITDKYNELIKKAKSYWAENTAIGKQKIEEIRVIRDLQLKALFKKQFDDNSEKEYSTSLKNLDVFFADQRNAAGKNYASGISTKKQYEAALKDIEARETQSRIQVATDYTGTVKKAVDDLTNFKKAAEQKQTADAIAESEKRQAATVNELLAAARLKILVAKPGTDKQLQAKKDLLQLEFNLDTEGLDKTSALYLEKNQILQQALADLDMQAHQEKINRLFEYANYAVTAFDDLNKIISNRETSAFNREKRLNDKKRNEFKKQLDNKLISQEQYDQKMLLLQQQQDAKQAELSRKQAKREKALTILSTILSTAQAVAGALAAKPIGPWNIAQAAVFGILGGLQVGIAASAPLPEFGRGGFLSRGPKHSDSQKGLHVVNPLTGQTEMLVEQGEAVLNARAMNSNRNMTLSGTPRQIASSLNSTFGGVSFASGASWLTQPMPQIKPGMARIMAGGGMIDSVATSPNTELAAQQQETINQLMGLRADMAGWNRSLKSTVVLKDIQNASNMYEAAKKASSITQ